MGLGDPYVQFSVGFSSRMGFDVSTSPCQTTAFLFALKSPLCCTVPLHCTLVLVFLRFDAAKILPILCGLFLRFRAVFREMNVCTTSDMRTSYFQLVTATFPADRSLQGTMTTGVLFIVRVRGRARRPSWHVESGPF